MTDAEDWSIVDPILLKRVLMQTRRERCVQPFGVCWSKMLLLLEKVENAIVDVGEHLNLFVKEDHSGSCRRQRLPFFLVHFSHVFVSEGVREVH